MFVAMCSVDIGNRTMDTQEGDEHGGLAGVTACNVYDSL